MKEPNKIDPVNGKILKATRTDSSLKNITIAECTELDGSNLYRGNCFVPHDDQLPLRLIQEHRDTALTDHPGRMKTYDLLDRHYYWKNMQSQVE